jgi:hypothetical protein
LPIESASEFEAVLGQSLIKIDKFMYERGKSPLLEDARRTLEKVMASARNGEQLKLLRDQLSEAAEVLRNLITRDEDLRNDLWDAMDFIDFRC